MFGDVLDLGVAATVLLGNLVLHRGDPARLAPLPHLTKGPPPTPTALPLPENIARRRAERTSTQNTERAKRSRNIGTDILPGTYNLNWL